MKGIEAFFVTAIFYDYYYLKYKLKNKGGRTLHALRAERWEGINAISIILSHLAHLGSVGRSC